MREIIFRGKRIDNGEWVYGYLYVWGRSGECEISCYDKTVNIERFSHVVNSETVGQFTGLTDKNGVKVFEGDIVRFKRVDALGRTRERVGQVLYYDKLPVFYILATTGDAWDWCDCTDIEVIGNVYDNADLLEG